MKTFIFLCFLLISLKSNSTVVVESLPPAGDRSSRFNVVLRKSVHDNSIYFSHDVYDDNGNVDEHYVIWGGPRSHFWIESGPHHIQMGVYTQAPDLEDIEEIHNYWFFILSPDSDLAGVRYTTKEIKSCLLGFKLGLFDRVEITGQAADPEEYSNIMIKCRTALPD